MPMGNIKNTISENLDNIFFVVIILILILMVVGVLIDSMKAPIEINSSDVGNHIDQKVSINLNISEHVDSGTKLDFIMPIMIPHTISTGKTCTTYTTVVFVPIFENYEVYSTNEGVYLAIDHDQDVKLDSNRSVTVIGHVRKEEKSNRYAIEVSKIM